MTSPDRGHLPQLDGLRALAVFAVMVHHFWREMSFGLPLGTLGVQLFFVLSGYLITRILISARQFVDAGSLSAGAAIRLFYVRRFLRIMPLFYLTLAVAWLSGLPEVRDSLPWHLTYASNLYFAKTGEWHGAVSHLWSLAVEEQFYLVWPFVVMLTPARSLLAALSAIALAAPIFRLVGMVAGLSEMALWTLPFASLDSLALGGVLGYMAGDGATSSSTEVRLRRMALSLGAPIVAGLWYCDVTQVTSPRLDLFRMGFENTAWAFLFTWLIGGAARGFAGFPGRFLASPAAAYLGRISYGLYVFHPFMRRVVAGAFTLAGVAQPTGRLPLFVCLVGTTVAAASCSWFLYERPLNDLKRAFTIGPRATASTRLIQAARP